MRPRIVVEPLAALQSALSALLQGECRHALSARGRFSIALSGGSVARAFYPRLSLLALDWNRTDFFWGDERAVAPHDPESNYDLARRLLLDPAQVPARRIHRMKGEAADLEAAAFEYEETLTRALGTPPCLDLVLLGVGPDGHVCSLFPGHPLLQETRRFVAAIHDSPKPPPARLSLTLPALAAARQIVVIALGTEKAEAIHTAFAAAGAAGNPLALAVRGARDVVALLDPEAARLL